MVTDDQRRRILLFNEKADELLSQPLLHAGVVGLRIELDAEGQTMTDELYGPTSYDVKAFVLTARFFVQDGDGISFRKLAEIYEDPVIPPSIADRHRDAREKWLAYLAWQPGMEANLKTLTIGDIFDVLFYGDLAHMNPTKRAEYEEWRKAPAFAALATYHLIGFLTELADFVRFYRALNIELLEAVPAAP